MDKDDNIGSETWDNINPDQPVPVPVPKPRKKGHPKLLSFFLTLSNTVLSMGVGVAIGFFVFWYAIGPKSTSSPQSTQALSSDPSTAIADVASQPLSGSVLGAQSENIVIITPKIGAAITEPLRLTGSALLINETLSVRLRDSKGQVFLDKTVPVKQSLVGAFSDFSDTLQFPKQPSGSTGTVEVFTKSLTNGQEADLVQVPINYK